MLDQSETLKFYRTGLFVLISFALLVFFVVFLAGVSWFHQPTYLETYFDESVQGLSEGSAVKYRGVAVGEVDEINFIADHYRDSSIAHDPHLARYVYVKMGVRTLSFLNGKVKSVGQKVAEAVANGLRVHLAQEGLTGKAYLELDFAEHDTDVLRIHWQPRLYYVPSRPSTLSTISASVNALFDGLKDVNFEALFKNIEQASHDMRQSFDTLNALLLMQQDNIARSLSNISNVTEHLGLIVENISAYPSGFLRTVPTTGNGGSQ